MDEQQLIAGCKSENRLAQRELYEKYARRMLAVCLRYVNDMETARDLLQDGFVRVFTNIHSYTGSGSFEGWLRKILENLSAAELMKVIQELPAGFRTVFNMFAIEGYSHKEISEILGITESTSRSQFTRARQLLQKRIKELYK